MRGCARTHTAPESRAARRRSRPGGSGPWARTPGRPLASQRSNASGIDSAAPFSTSSAAKCGRPRLSSVAAGGHRLVVGDGDAEGGQPFGQPAVAGHPVVAEAGQLVLQRALLAVDEVDEHVGARAPEGARDLATAAPARRPAPPPGPPAAGRPRRVSWSVSATARHPAAAASSGMRLGRVGAVGRGRVECAGRSRRPRRYRRPADGWDEAAAVPCARLGMSSPAVPGTGARRRPARGSDEGQRATMKEACGVFGVYAPGRLVAQLTFDGIYALQHRGQESAGMAVSDGETVTVVKDMGLVATVFDERTLSGLHGPPGHRPHPVLHPRQPRTGTTPSRPTDRSAGPASRSATTGTSPRPTR